MLTDIQCVLIGDDMGLGKSAQAIALDMERRAKQPNLVKRPKTLVISPLAMVSTWTRYWAEWAPSLKVMAINNKDRHPFIQALLDETHDVYIIHWPVVRLVQELQLVNWFHVIADECHGLQNRKAQQTKAVKRMKSWYKTGLSGTPAYDKPDDLWSILNWLYPKYWSSYWRYFDNHILWTDYSGYRQIVGIKNAEVLQQEMSGFYIRRKKSDVLLDLPEKYYTEIYVELDPKQKRAYEQMRKDMLSWIGDHEHEPLVAPVVIAQLIRLQQFACAYVEYNNDGKPKLAEPSSKLDACIELIQGAPGQVVVFSQFSQAVELLSRRLEKLGISYGLYTGNTTAARRNEILERFEKEEIKVFAGTISAGGVGINLTTANTVIFLDRAWSPALNYQAEDRCHRMGQKNAVQIFDIIAVNTIDSKRLAEIQQKWEWLKELLGD